jgi:hypothetical protein
MIASLTLDTPSAVSGNKADTVQMALAVAVSIVL